METLRKSDRAAVRALLISEHPAVYAEEKFGYINEPFHEEWYEAELVHPRLCIVAPREYAKSEVFSVNSTCWFGERWPGSHQWIFEDSLEQGKLMLERIISAMTQANPAMTDRMWKEENTDAIFSNFSRVTVAGRGQRKRGARGDRIVGDDILDEESTHTRYQRAKVERWWDGTVANMAHPGMYRRLGWGHLKGAGVPMLWYPPTTIRLVGTPFHQADALMRMRKNRLYHFRRYEAEFDVADLVPGTMAVEVLPLVA